MIDLIQDTDQRHRDCTAPQYLRVLQGYLAKFRQFADVKDANKTFDIAAYNQFNATPLTVAPTAKCPVGN